MNTQQPGASDNGDVLDRRFLLGGLTGIAGIAAISAVGRRAGAGPINPPAGAVGSTGRTLGEVEPRVPIGPVTTPATANSMFTISQPGSYYLTGNVVGAIGKGGIEIAASDVTIDLCGFALIGVPGSLEGIACRTSGLTNAAVFNGTVRGWGGAGVDLLTNPLPHSRLEGVRAMVNGGRGLRVNGVAAACEATGNSGVGIEVGQGSLVVECVSRNNLDDGYELGSGSAAARCVAFANAGVGIGGGSSLNVTECSTVNNTAEGIVVVNASVVSRCTARNNVGPGIVGGNGNLISGCAANGNGGGISGAGAGIRTSSTDNRVEGNNCASNGIGIEVASTGSFITRNTCSGNGTNWSVASGNVFLAVQAVFTGVAVNGAAGGVAPGSTDPNANFSY